MMGGWGNMMAAGINQMTEIYKAKQMKREQKAARAFQLGVNREIRGAALKQLSPEAFQKFGGLFFGSGLLNQPMISPGTPAVTRPSRFTFGPQAAGGLQTAGAAPGGAPTASNSVAASAKHALLRGLSGSPRQLGGAADAGERTTVGEQGPEQFVPAQPGTIVPNGTPLVGGGGGGGGGGGAPAQQPQLGGPSFAGNYTSPQTQVGDQLAGQATEPVYGQSPGELYTQQLTNFLQNPGQISTVQYERAQEQAGRGLNTALQNIVGGMSGSGFDPSSGMGMTLQQSAVLNSAQQRIGAARDLALMEETMRRQDIGAGANMYLGALSYLMNVLGGRASTQTGTPLPGTPPVTAGPTSADPYGAAARGINTYTMLAAQNQQQPQAGGGAGAAPINYFAGTSGGMGDNSPLDYSR